MSAVAKTSSWAPRRSARTLVPSVRVDGSDGSVHTHVLARERTVVGSAERADIRLADVRVSRIHCELVREDDGLRLRDLGSKNGCWVGGQRVIEAVLSIDAEVRVGRTTLRIASDPRSVTDGRWRGGDRFFGLVGHGAAMHAVFTAATRLADLKAAVLVRGEAGTGKELLARAIHATSRRADGPFVVVDCTALPPTRADIELFGHVRGAFTGATRKREGVFERADGGTLFLGHVEALPLAVQARLLRVLDTGMARRLGEFAERWIDARVIASTTPALDGLVARGAFRDDLVYRLSVFTIDVPPLRRRRDDIRTIANDLLSEIGPISPEVQRTLEVELANRAFYSWPGNVRELQSLVRRIAYLGEDAALADTRLAGVGSLPHVDVSVPFHDAADRRSERRSARKSDVGRRMRGMRGREGDGL